MFHTRVKQAPNFRMVPQITCIKYHEGSRKKRSEITLIDALGGYKVVDIILSGPELFIFR